MNSENVVSWSSILRVSLVLLIIAAVIWFGVIAIPLIEALLVAGLLGYLLNPVVAFLTRRTRLTRSWAAGLVYIGSLAALMGIPAITGTVPYGQYRRYQTDLGAALNALLETLSRPVPFLGLQLDMDLILTTLQQPTAEVMALPPGGIPGHPWRGGQDHSALGIGHFDQPVLFSKDGPEIKPSYPALSGGIQAQVAESINESTSCGPVLGAVVYLPGCPGPARLLWGQGS